MENPTGTWRERIKAAKQRRGLFVRGFSRRDLWQAGDWARCAVGEQVQLGRVRAEIIEEDPRMRKLGLQFYRAVVLSRVFGWLAIRRAERLLGRIEDYALELDLRRSMILPWLDCHPASRPAVEPSEPASARRA
jgi:hypothetical protein